MIDDILFWAFAALSVTAALGVVLHRSIIYSALLLIVVFLSIAGVFVLNNADFLAVAQTVVYAVGLTIIILFGIMLTSNHEKHITPLPKAHLAGYALVTLMGIGLLVTAVISTGFQVIPHSSTYVATLAAEGSTVSLGRLLFGTYALPFEVASILLLVAMIGAIILSKKRFTMIEDVFGHIKYTIEDASTIPAQAKQALLQSKSDEGAQPAASNDQSNVSEAVGV
jgi:NADH:ubiquinone oxidoreductase subunit 6 (subunit J)